MDTLKPLAPPSLPNKNQFYPIQYKVRSPAEVPGGSSRGARRVQLRCPAGPAEVPGGSRQGARRVQPRCPAGPGKVPCYCQCSAVQRSAMYKNAAVAYLSIPAACSTCPSSSSAWVQCSAVQCSAWQCWEVYGSAVQGDTVYLPVHPFSVPNL